MNSDFWTTRLAAAKRQFNLQHHHLSHSNGFSQLDRFGRDGFEVEEDTRSDFPCPYCFEEVDIASLCPHLEDEHPSESRPAICPVCSAKVTRDVLSHITLQHGHLFKISFCEKKISIYYCMILFIHSYTQNVSKISITYSHFQRRRRLRRVPVPNSQALSQLGKDLREAHLQALLGGSTYQSNNAASSNAAAAVADPFLSSLVLNFTGSESEEISKSMMSSIEEISSKSDASLSIWKSSCLDSSLSREEREERTRQATGRAVFLQDLLFSALFSD